MYHEDYCAFDGANPFSFLIIVLPGDSFWWSVLWISLILLLCNLHRIGSFLPTTQFLIEFCRSEWLFLLKRVWIYGNSLWNGWILSHKRAGMQWPLWIECLYGRLYLSPWCWCHSIFGIITLIPGRWRQSQRFGLN